MRVPGLVDGFILSAAYASDKYKEWKEKKEMERLEALENLEKIARQKIHLKKPYGFCVLVTTEKCAIKSMKKKKES